MESTPEPEVMFLILKRILPGFNNSKPNPPKTLMFIAFSTYSN